MVFSEEKILMLVKIGIKQFIGGIGGIQFCCIITNKNVGRIGLRLNG